MMPALVEVWCSDETHEIILSDDGELVLLDHPHLEEEIAINELGGGERRACVALYQYAVNTTVPYAFIMNDGLSLDDKFLIAARIAKRMTSIVKDEDVRDDVEDAFNAIIALHQGDIDEYGFIRYSKKDITTAFRTWISKEENCGTGATMKQPPKCRFVSAVLDLYRVNVNSYLYNVSQMSDTIKEAIQKIFSTRMEIYKSKAEDPKHFLKMTQMSEKNDIEDIIAALSGE